MNIYTAKFTAFVYRWNQKSTGKWYIGSRTAKGCHVNDGYTCSSKIVKPLIESNPEGWSREILAMGESKFMVQVEAEILQELDAKSDPNSFNLHNGDGKFSNTGKKHTPTSRAKLRSSSLNRYQNMTPEIKAARSKKMRVAQQNMTPEAKAARSKKLSAYTKNRPKVVCHIETRKEYHMRHWVQHFSD